MGIYAIYLIKNHLEYHIKANNIDEALGKFFKIHSELCYVDILEHLEI